jgi:hypothetical protein
VCYGKGGRKLVKMNVQYVSKSGTMLVERADVWKEGRKMFADAEKY